MKRIVVLILRVTVAVIFLWAGVTKAWNPARFSHDILEYRLVSQWTAAAVALYLPWLELTCGVTLLLPRTAHAAALLLILMLSAFSTAILSALYRGLEMNCGCFGGGGEGTSLEMAMLRNALLFAALIGILIVHRDRAQPAPAARVVAGAAPIA